MFFRSHGKQFFYAFPLFSLISHCLHKIVRVEAEGMIDCFLLAYPALYSCLICPTVDVPRTLLQQLSMLKMPGKEHEARPLIKKMFLMAFRLSGNPLKCREFLRGLVTSSYSCGDVELSNSTHLTLQRELHFCGSLQIDCVSPTSSQA